MRGDAGQRKLPTDFASLIEGLALRKPRPSIAVLHREVTKIATERQVAAPSYATVHAIVLGINPALTTLAHEGVAAFRNRYELIHRHRAEAPNALWQADHTPVDILIVDANGQPARPWLTIIIDDYSRAIAGYMAFLGAPSSLHTSLALRQAIWRKANPSWPIQGILGRDTGAAESHGCHLEQNFGAKIINSLPLLSILAMSSIALLKGRQRRQNRQEVAQSSEFCNNRRQRENCGHGQ
jgi:transposase InsO family protein